ncbi:nucleotide exchange factor GrpE [Glycomyces terrestris]|uniref:Nucleotide exchange factor GrpE n=1 Tax=Glycomyces terrestris TaxID=2493553 RepID=A0A426UWS8_9ACTN|nr:nucleotide exchange factor GrpE [Glycomyces terrestris]RRR98653.1 nucleotide exchange factor GrpE [Glycomyces terrestris]
MSRRNQHKPRKKPARPAPDREARRPPPPEPGSDADVAAALAAAREATLGLAQDVDAQREQLTAMLRGFLNIERAVRARERDPETEKETAGLLNGIADVMDQVDRWALDEAADAAQQRDRFKALSARLEKLVVASGRAELLGRVGETAKPATHEWREVRHEPGKDEDTVLEVWARGVRYRGELLRPAVVIAASGEGASE